jgi:hypothetical protein
MPLRFDDPNIRFPAAPVPSITVSFSNPPYETMLKDGLPTRPTMTLCSAETGSLAGKVCVPKTSNPTIVVMKSAKDGA